jgi:hypothetical protein
MPYLSLVSRQLAGLLTLQVLLKGHRDLICQDVNDHGDSSGGHQLAGNKDHALSKLFDWCAERAA